MKRLTQEEYEKILFKCTNGNVTCVDEYINVRTPIKHYCKKHNAIFSAYPALFTSGGKFGCKKCINENTSKRQFYTNKQFCEKLSKVHNGELFTTEQYIGCTEKMTFIHKTKNFEHSFISSWSEIRGGKKCPYCSNKKVLVGFNDLCTTNPDIASLLNNREDGYKYTCISTKKVDFKCPDCGFLIKDKSISMIVKNGLSCPCCSDGLSYPNKFMCNLLKQAENQLDLFKNEYSPDWCTFEFDGKLKTGRYDFYFEKQGKKYIVEMDGGLGHGKENSFQLSKEDSLKIDNIKDQLALSRNIQVIRIDCYYKGKENRFNFIKSNVIQSELNNILDLSVIDFDNINQKCLESVLLQCCELWKHGYKVTEISKIFNINYATVTEYLKTGTNIGLCNYDKYYSTHTSKEKKVYCLTTNKLFDNSKIAAETYGVSINSIQKNCSGNAKIGGKDKDGNILYWCYYDDYLRMTKEELQDKCQPQNNHFKKVVCLNNNFLFDKIIYAANWCNVAPSGIGENCRGKILGYGYHPETGEHLHWMFYNDYVNQNKDASILIQQ